MNEDNLSPEKITRNLGTRLVGQRVLYYPTVASTNESAKQEARQGAAEGTVVIAGEQTAGKGRLGRTWLSPRGVLVFSIVLHPKLPQLPYLIMIASLAIVHAIGKVTGLKSQIKWPNDVLSNGKKVCGILIENGMRGNNVDYSVIGIGLNVNLKLSDFPEIAMTGTSLSAELGKEVSLLKMVRQSLTELDRLYLALSAGDAVFEEWRANLVTLGKPVRVTSGKTVTEGIAESVDRDGSLLLRQADGSLTRIAAGDVTLRT